MTEQPSGVGVQGWRDANDLRDAIRHWANRIRVSPRSVRIRPMAKKWASCSAKGHVTFASQLLDEPSSFGEYVIVHEMLHLRIPNHGKLFKSLLRAYLPDSKEPTIKAFQCGVGERKAV